MSVLTSPRSSLHQLPNAIYAAIPFRTEPFFIQAQPGRQRRQATDHFFFSDLKGRHMASSRGLEFSRAASIRSLSAQ